MDKYTKFILTIIAVGVVGINLQMLSGNIITSAHADNHTGVQKVQICDGWGVDCAMVGKYSNRLYVEVDDK